MSSLNTGTTTLPRRIGAALGLALTLALGACGDHSPTTSAPLPAGKVDERRLLAVDTEPGVWLSSGRDAGKTHYSPLDAINRESVSRLGFAWEFQTGTNRGMQSTPLVIDGVMYTSGVAGRVYALDPVTGKAKWQFEPQVDLRNARSACCDIVNRGISVWQGKVYVAAFDGKLYALDAADGKVLWQVDTFTDRHRAYSITGAPQIAGKVVVIGNGGAEYDSRGYVSAYDLQTGKLVWRFYTVPGDPSQPYENKALEMAAKTWKGTDYWQRGGGGNAWEAFNYDPQLNLVYFGTANGAPWSRTKRSDGSGDNLFLASIIALNADTGEYVWHYQTTPGERWDYDATPHIMLATLKLGGVDRNVLMQASKNGFFYVLDRKTGELLSADPFVATTWANKVDLATGRPVENVASADYSDGKPKLIFPSSVGGHNFNPMSLSPRTGLVYIPSVHSGMVLMEAPPTPLRPGRISTGVQVAFSSQLAAPQSLPEPMRKLADPKFLKTQPDIAMSASLKAWDPVNRKVVWEFKNSSFMDHGGVLSTGGGIVVQGGLDGKLKVFNDETGALLKEIDVGTAMVAAPMTYSVAGQQYIAITAGTGGGGWNMWFPENIASKNGNANRILAFRLDGGVTPVPDPLPPLQPLPEPPQQTGTAADIKKGGELFAANCGQCHANAPRSPVPDLRRASAATHAAFQQIVRGGALQPRGMPAWDDLLSEQDVEQIHDYVISTAREGYAQQQKAGAVQTAPVRKGVTQGHM